MTQTWNAAFWSKPNVYLIVTMSISASSWKNPTFSSTVLVFGNLPHSLYAIQATASHCDLLGEPLAEKWHCSCQCSEKPHLAPEPGVLRCFWWWISVSSQGRVYWEHFKGKHHKTLDFWPLTDATVSRPSGQKWLCLLVYVTWVRFGMGLKANAHFSIASLTTQNWTPLYAGFIATYS